MSLKASKSAGTDNIPSTLIKDGAEKIAAPLTFLINLSLQLGTFPTTEKTAKTPIFKSGDRTLPDNYRPISVLNVFSKVLERIVYNQLSTFLERKNLLYRHQYGFRRHRSTEHAVTMFVDNLRMNTNNSQLTGAVYVDLRKAFDTVHHASLLHKLPSFGISGKEHLWFSDYLFNRSQYVVIDSIQSDVSRITHGVPQGSILGPLLFILLINDMNTCVQKCSLVLYADDAVLFFGHKNANEIELTLNNELNAIYDWLFDNHLIINLKKGKTEFVLYGSRQKLSKSTECSISINGTTISSPDEYEYLGVTLDKTLTLKTQIDKVYKKSSSRLKLLKRIRSHIPSKVAVTIFQSVIEPLSMYCGMIYGNLHETGCKKIQTIQDRGKSIIRDQSYSPATLRTLRDRKVATQVFKSLNKLTPECMHDKFKFVSHGIRTRGNGSLLKLPSVRTEAGRKSFEFYGALVFNKLPKELRDQKSLATFKRNVKLVSFE